MAIDKPWHLMRFGIHADASCFEKMRDEYDFFVANANMVEYTAKALGALISKRLMNVDYIIDPGTHAFAQTPDSIMSPGKAESPENIKKSIAKLAESYGLTIGAPIGVRPLKPSDFDDILNVNQFASTVINFQLNRMSEALKEDQKYLPEDAVLAKPYAVVAPYFYLSPATYTEWLPLNIRMIDASRSHVKDGRLFVEIVISNDFLAKPDEMENVVSEYLKNPVYDGILLWVSDFPEHLADERSLTSFVDLCLRLKESGKPVVNLYGGYFSILLWKIGLDGVCHGPGYGEDRGVIPVGGGPPELKYYFTPIHKRISYRDVEFLIAQEVWETQDEFMSEVCSGKICKATLQAGLQGFYEFGVMELKRRDDNGSYYEVMSTASRERMKKHFVEAKSIEHRNVSVQDGKQLIAQLEESYSKYKKYFGKNDLAYMERWVNTLKNSLNK